jgi:vacuolar-type H+-ATPase subunit E/Vma4
VEKNSGLIVGMSIALGVLAGAIVAANIAMNAWKAISVITAGVNYALAASFTAVQIATGIGIIAVVAGTAAFVAYKKSMESAKAEAESLAGATNNLTGAFVGPQLTAKQLEERMKAFNTQGTGTKTTVESLAKALKEKLGEALDAANDKLDDAKRAFTDFATSVSDGLKDAFSFGDAQDAGKETGKGFIQGLRDQVTGIVDYSKKIQELLDKNLSKDALQQVLASGAEAGMAIADQLIKGGQTAIDETNALVDSANAAAGKVGLNAAGKWFQEGVNTAQKLVDGITGELDKLTPKLMKKMDEIAAKMKRNVNIDVVVTERVNKIISTFGGGIPAMAEGGIVNRPTLALIGEAGPEAVVPLSKMGAGGGDVNINVNGGLATSAEIGQTVLNALRAYQRSAGPLNLNIA